MRTRSRQHAKRDGGGGGLPRANSDPSPRSQARNQAAALPAARQPGLLAAAAAAAAAAGPNSLDHASSGSSSGSTGSNHVEGSLVPLVRSFSTGFLGEDGARNRRAWPMRARWTGHFQIGPSHLALRFDAQGRTGQTPRRTSSSHSASRPQQPWGSGGCGAMRGGGGRRCSCRTFSNSAGKRKGSPRPTRL